MTATALLDELRRRGVRLEASGDRLRVSAPRGALDPRLRDLLAAHKQEILVTLRRVSDDRGRRREPPPLAPAPRDRPPVLSFAQERLWFLDRLVPGSPAYNIPLGVRLHGSLRVDVLERTLRAIVQRHEVLRTGCTTRDGEPVLERMATSGPAGEVAVPVQVHDLRDRVAAQRDEEWARLLAIEARRPFDLARPPFLRAILARLDDASWTGLLVTHHFVADGWSMATLLRELGALYHAFARDLPSPLPPLPVQYADYAAWQRAWLAGSELEAQLDVWRARLAGMPARLELPTDRARPPLRSGRGGRIPFVTSPDLADALRALARGSRATLFMVLLAAFQALLGRYARSRDVAVATAVSNRRRLETEPLVGFFANNLVLRGDLGGDPTFRELVDRTRRVAVEAYANQDVPFEKLVEALRPGRDLAHTPLFQVMFVLENAPLPAVRLSELALEAFEVDTGSARFDLTLALRETTDGLAGSLEYDADLFAAESAARLLEHYRTLLEAAARYPDRRLSELPLAPEAEQVRAIGGWNDTVRSWGGFRPLHGRIADQARRSPGAIAVECDGELLTYAELESRANRLAHRLVREGARPDARVAVLLERSLDLSVALLAVLKAGAAYVPLDPAYPVERLAFMLEDSGALLVLTRADLAGRLPPGDGTASDPPRLLLLDREAQALAGEPGDDPVVPVDPAQLAYVIYTSGSTGQPKGAANTHAGIENRLLWMQDQFALGPADRVLHKTPTSFDVSVWELFWPLLAGARLVHARPGDQRDPAALARLIAGRGITVAHFVPSLLRAFLEHGPLEPCASLRLVVASGEVLPPDLVERFHERLAGELHNLYGPTEASVDVTHWPCRREDPAEWGRRIPIGRPIANLRTYVVDENFRPVPVGVPGELLLGGIGLARGYLGRPALTAERFLPDPFSPEPGSRIYRTGDLARWRGDGVLDFLGRVDDQVKIRGVRVEPAEIEAALHGHPQVREAAVVAHDFGGRDLRLVAYVVRRDGTGDQRPAVLREFLAARLPEVMVPAHFIALASLPMTPSGKLDRRRLPTPDGADLVAGGPFVPPRPGTEAALALQWAELLGAHRVGSGDDFFELGGHSLIAVRLLSRIRECFGAELPLRAVFSAPTLAAMAVEIERAAPACNAPAEDPAVFAAARAGSGGAAPLSYFQERLWFLEQFEPGNPSLNIPLSLRLSGRLDPDALTRALDRIVARHESLRTCFGDRDGVPVASVASEARLELPLEDLSELAAEAREDAVGSWSTGEARAPFDLARAPLARARLLRLGSEDHVLLLTLHHIVADGWALALLVEELGRVYEAMRRGLADPLAPLTLQFTDYALWQRERLAGARLAAQLDFWRSNLAGAPPWLELPTDHARPALQTFRGERVTRNLPADRARRAWAAGRARGATPFMTLLSSFAAVLGRWSGQSEVVVGTAVSGRLRKEFEAVVGPFLNTVALRLDLSSGPDFDGLLAIARATALAAFENQEAPFEKVLEAVQPPRELSRTPVFQAFLNVLNFPVATFELSELRLAAAFSPDPPSKFDLTLYAAETDAGWQLDLVYNADLFARARMEELLAQVEQFLDAAVADPGTPVSCLSILTPAARRVLPDPAAPLDDRWEGAIHELFGAHARALPARTALAGGAGEWTYGQLALASGAIAQRLRAAGVGRGGVVAIHAARGPTLVAAILGTLEAGAAFLVLDRGQPALRNRRCLEQARPAVLLALESAGPLPSDLEAAWPAAVLRLDIPAARAAIAALAPAAGGRTAGGAAVESSWPDDVACVAFTSGTTGSPRGVVGLHRSLTHFVPWLARTFGLGPDDRLSLLSGLSHDPLQREIFTALQLGATIAIPPEDVFAVPGALAAWLASARVTVVHLTPAMLDLLLEEATGAPACLPALRLAFIVGDTLRRRDVARLLRLAPGVTCINFYGATETQRAVGHHVISRADLAGGEAPPHHEALPLGHGIPDVQLLVLRPDGGLAGVGEVGEVHVRSPHLARGYLGDPALTAERFAVNAFTGREGDRVYRSGDLGRYRPDGSVESAGRADRQVKIRGFRVEPAEVESALEDHPQVRRAAVVPWDGDARPGGSGRPERRLVAYVVPAGGAGESAAQPSAADLRGYLAGRLPAAMIPATFVSLPRLPLTPNGKLDRAALPDPGSAHGESDGDLGSRARILVPPRDRVELELVRLWQELLGREPIGVREDFFALGGHSLLAVRMLAQVHAAFGARLSLATLFQGGTIEALAIQVRHSQKGADRVATTGMDRSLPPRSPLVRIQSAGSLPPFFCVHPVGGTVLCYRGLAQRLGNDRPFLGLEARGVDGEAPPLRSVEAMAAHYLAAVREHQPRGPYHLGGWSFGGLVAYEMFLRLTAAGEEGSLALIDTWPPGSLGAMEDEIDQTAVLRLLARALGELAGLDFEVSREALARLGGREEQLAHVVAEARRSGALPPDVGVAELRPLFDVVEANVEARRSYRPPPSDASLHLVRAQTPLVPPPADPTLGWAAVARGGVEVSFAPGDHYTMLAEPHVERVAALLALRLEAGAARS